MSDSDIKSSDVVGVAYGVLNNIAETPKAPTIAQMDTFAVTDFTVKITGSDGKMIELDAGDLSNFMNTAIQNIGECKQVLKNTSELLQDPNSDLTKEVKIPNKAEEVSIDCNLAGRTIDTFETPIKQPAP